MPYDHDEWRRNYDTMTLEDQKREYNKIYDLTPLQRSFDVEAVKDFLNVNKPHVVLEIEGWDGALAEKILNDESFNSILAWYNYDICTKAMEIGLANPRYWAVIPDRWIWDINLPVADALIACDFIEHIRLYQLKKLFSHIPEGVKAVYLSSPLEEKGVSWDGYGGTHILEVGWDEIETILRSMGFVRYSIFKTARMFNR